MLFIRLILLKDIGDYMIGFVVAMEKEARLFLNQVEIIKEYNIAGKRVSEGKYLNNKIVLIIAGIGKVNASFSTQIIIDKFSPSIIINFGVAGGKSNSGLFPGDVVLLDKVCQYDFDLSEIDNVKVGYMQDYNTIYYNTNVELYSGNKFLIRTGATGDRFTKQEYFNTIIKELSANVIDMESGAIVQVCTANEIPFLTLKLISDVDDVENSIFDQYQKNIASVCDKIPNALDELVSHLKY